MTPTPNNRSNPVSPKIIAIAGGSCSGKTSLARHLADTLGTKQCNLIYQDSYYHGRAEISNYDEPSAIEFELLAQHLAQLKSGSGIDMPTYDFTTHSRLPQTEFIAPKPVIIVDGILILHAEVLRASFDLAVFVECDQDIRRQRRLLRDCQERGREPEEVTTQFDKQVAPLHNLYVEPSKQHANIVYRNNGEQEVDQLVCERLLTFCQGN
ncbi:uridine kinase [Halioxenophilus aromaticivorans]|uniref:uridine/cytidine kinase n=1 Tax=Halioxenophilus aromaticivorans TaxID=1306992 RepID=A0AAV3U7E5_9ALTE